MDHYSWLENLIDRDADIEVLLGAYRATLAANSPTSIVLLAESGVGKTRLVRELYMQLASQYDAIRYWPRRFSGNLVELDLTPDFSAQPDLPAGSTPPFLWWPIRFSRPDTRNRILGGRSAVSNSAPHLAGHLAVASQSALINGTGKSLLDLGVDALLELGSEALLPYAGFIKSCLLKVREGAIRRKEISRIKAASLNPGKAVTDASHEMIDDLSEGLSIIVSPKANGGMNVPLVLVLDDLQWIDAVSFDQLFKLLSRAHVESWPLLIVATAWPADWDAAASEADKPLTRFKKLLRETGGASRDINEFRLLPIKNRLAILSSALPGLSASQQDLILEKFGSDLYMLAACLNDLRKKRYCFVDQDFSRPLNANGIKQVVDYSTERVGFVHDRFNELSFAAQSCLSVAALLGRRAHMEFAESLAASATASDGNDAAKFRLSEEACRWLVREPLPGICEFVDEVVHSVAETRLLAIDSELSVAVLEGLKTAAAWIASGKAEVMPHFQLVEFIAGARKLVSLAETKSVDFDSKDLHRLSVTVRLLGEIVEGFEVDTNDFSAPTAAEATLAESSALSSLSVAWRARWLKRASRSGPWLWRGGKPLARQLRKEALDLMHSISLQIGKGALELELVEAGANAARTSVALSWALVNDINLNGDLPEFFADTQAEKWKESRAAELTVLETETIGRIIECLEALEHTNTETSRAIEACLLVEQLRMTVHSSDSNAAVKERIADCLNSMPFKEDRGENWMRIVFENGPLADTLFAWKHQADARASRKKVVARIYAELGNYSQTLLGTFQLLSLGVALRSVDIEEHMVDLKARLDQAFALDLELIRRGLGEIVLYWGSDFASTITFAMGLHSRQSSPSMSSPMVPDDYLESGWQAMEASLRRLKNVIDRSSEDTAARLVMRLVRTMAEQCLDALGPDSLQDYLSRVTSAAQGQFRDLEVIARYAWMSSCVERAQVFAGKSLDFHLYASGYSAMAGVPRRFSQVLLGDHERHEKTLEMLAECLSRRQRPNDIVYYTSIAALNQLQSSWCPASADWKDIVSQSVLLTVVGGHRTPGADDSLVKRLKVLWLSVLGSVHADDDRWEPLLPEIMSITNQICPEHECSK